MKFLTRKGFLIEEQGMSYLADTDPDTRPGALRAAACTYRIALGPRAGQKVLSLQTVPTQEAPPTPVRCVNEQGFSLHAEVFCAAHERHKLESQAQGYCLLGVPRTQHYALAMIFSVVEGAPAILNIYIAGMCWLYSFNGEGVQEWQGHD